MFKIISRLHFNLNKTCKHLINVKTGHKYLMVKQIIKETERGKVGLL